MDTVGGRIQAARIGKGLTQEKLGELVGVSKGAVSQWEAGDIKSLKAENLLRLGEVTEVSVRWIWRGKESDGTPVPSGRPKHLEPEELDLVDTFKVLPADKRDELISIAHRLLRDTAAQQPSRANPYPQAPKSKKPLG